MSVEGQRQEVRGRKVGKGGYSWWEREWKGAHLLQCRPAVQRRSTRLSSRDAEKNWEQ